VRERERGNCSNNDTNSVPKVPGHLYARAFCEPHSPLLSPLAPLRLAHKLFASIGLQSWHTKEGRRMWPHALMGHFKETNTVRGMEYSDGIDGEEAFATVALLLLLAVYCVEAAVSTCGPCCCVSAGASLLPLAALQAAEPQPIRKSQPAPSGKQATAALVGASGSDTWH